MTDPAQEFWNYSVKLYSVPGVANACLSLQDSHDIDVNLLLFACWYGETYGNFSPAILQQALSFSQPWRKQVVQPLRNVRRWLKLQATPEEALRKEVKRIELEAEQVQQNRLQTLAQTNKVTRSSPGLKAIRNNLDALFEALEVELQSSQDYLKTILQAIGD